MIHEVTHIGITVRSLETSVAFYRDVLGLRFVGELTMQGEETDKLFCSTNCEVKIAYLNGSEELLAPPIELIQFQSEECQAEEPSLKRTSISEICFRVEDIEEVYANLKSKGVEFLSEPQFFDFTKDGFTKSKAVYFKDPDGIILELMQYIYD